MTAQPSQYPAALNTNNHSLSHFEASVEHHFVPNNGVQIHYAAAGAGPLLVFLHGFPDHWLGWWKVMEEFRANYRVVALDLRGYNLSSKPEESQAYKISHLVADVRAVIESEGEEAATIIGHDWGGFIAWHTAMDAPEIVNRLIVLNMPHPWAIARELAHNPEQRKASEYVRFFRQPESHLQFPTTRLGAWVTDPIYKTRHDDAMQRSSIRAMLNYYSVNWPAEPYVERTDAPRQVKAPTLLIHGLADVYALPAGLNDVWKWVDNEVTIRILPGAGHFVQHENSSRITSILRNWLD